MQLMGTCSLLPWQSQTDPDPDPDRPRQTQTQTHSDPCLYGSRVSTTIGTDAHGARIDITSPATSSCAARSHECPVPICGGAATAQATTAVQLNGWQRLQHSQVLYSVRRLTSG